MTNMNNWQKVYCDTYFNGKKPRTNQGKHDVELLGMVKSEVSVEFADGSKKIFVVTADDCDMPNGKISVRVLVSNLNLWLSRGYKVGTR